LEQKHRKQGSSRLEAESLSRLEAQVSQKAKATEPLESELDRLKLLTGLGHGLTVVWIPRGSSVLSGKVQDNVIFIYDEELEKALCTLRHEFTDFLVCLAIEPYIEVTALYKAMISGLLDKLGEDAYLKKERVIEAISQILNMAGGSRGADDAVT